MRFNPVDDKTADASGFQPWPAGEYPFEIKECSEEISKAGSEMLKLTIHIFNKDGASRTVFDYLLGTDKGQWKVRHFAKSVGLLASYEAGSLDINDVFGRSGRCKVSVRPERDGFQAQNQVVDYLGEAASQTPARRAMGNPAPVSGGGKRPAADLDDEIPF